MTTPQPVPPLVPLTAVPPVMSAQKAASFPAFGQSSVTELSLIESDMMSPSRHLVGAVEQRAPLGLAVRSRGCLPEERGRALAAAVAGGEFRLGGDGQRILVQRTTGAGPGEQDEPGRGPVREPVCHGAVQLDHRAWLKPNEPVVAVRDPAPVG